jgi:YegS/Rv2252/BmrU family lipid kinase
LTHGVARARRALVVANPAAGLRRGRRAGEEAAAGLARAGIAVEVRVTSGPGDAREAASRAESSGFDLVVAAGGDGTVHEAANGLAGSGVALAVAPSGTMNLLARVLGVPLDPTRAMDELRDGYERLAIRPGSAGDRIFVLMAGAGFDAWVLRELLATARGKIGFGDYVRGAIRGLRTFPFSSLHVFHDGGTTDAHTVIVGRAPLYGGLLRPTPHVDLSGDALEMCALSGGALRLAAVVPRLATGAHAGLPGVTLRPVTRLALGAADGRDVPFHLDGELTGSLPLEIGLSCRMLVLASPRRGR